MTPMATLGLRALTLSVPESHPLQKEIELAPLPSRSSKEALRCDKCQAVIGEGEDHEAHMCPMEWADAYKTLVTVAQRVWASSTACRAGHGHEVPSHLMRALGDVLDPTRVDNPTTKPAWRGAKDGAEGYDCDGRAYVTFDDIEGDVTIHIPKAKEKVPLAAIDSEVISAAMALCDQDRMPGAGVSEHYHDRWRKLYSATLKYQHRASSAAKQDQDS